MRNGHYERHLNRMRSLYKGKHDLLLRWLKDSMGNVCAYSGENAGVHLLVHLKNGLSEQEAVARAAGAGVRVYGLSEFLVSGQTPPIPATVLLGVCHHAGGRSAGRHEKACGCLERWLFTGVNVDRYHSQLCKKRSSVNSSTLRGVHDINLDKFFTMKYT